MTLMELPTRRPAGDLSTFQLADLPPWDLAQLIAKTEFVPKGLQGRPEAVLACFLYGHEIGVGPMESLAQIAIIEGRPAISAQLMRARVLTAGHEIWEEDGNTTRVTMAGRRSGADRIQTVTWTLDDARKAGLGGRANWTRYPRQMLEARATAHLCRLIFPDVLGASRYAIEEEGDGDGPLEGIGPENASQTPTKAKRRRTPARTVTATAETELPRPPLPGEPLDTTDQPDPTTAGLTLMSKPQRDRMFASLTDAGLKGRDEYLEFAAEIIQRPITSSGELTPAEGAAVTEAALAIAAQMRPTTDEPEPPPAPGDADHLL